MLCVFGRGDFLVIVGGLRLVLGGVKLHVIN